MHPAYSVIFFTTASGAGYGLLALIALFSMAGLLPPDTWLGFTCFAVSLGLISAGLLSSILHLGHPERFLKALTQWRSSWLAREGVAAIVTFAPAGLFGIGWVFFNSIEGLFSVAAGLSAIMAVITVACTAMIYASLTPIRQWNNRLVLPAYLALSGMTGAVLLEFISRLFGVHAPVFGVLTAVLIAAAWAIKFFYWRYVDASRSPSTLGTATGLEKLGEIKLLEMPHTEENFLMREMGYQIARKHSQRLRLIVHAALFAIPLALTAIALPDAMTGVAGILLLLVAVLSALIGVAVERWLFFAEAAHVSMLYYGRAV